MARQAYQEQLLKLNGELIEMGDLCEEADVTGDESTPGKRRGDCGQCT